MRRKVIKSLLIIAMIHLYHSMAFCLTDTLITKIDTIFCVSIGDTVTLKTDLDTSKYDFVWVKYNMLSDTLSFSNQLGFFKSDTIIRTSIPKDTLTLIIDTINISLHFPPIIMLDGTQQPIECYNEDNPIILKSYSSFDTLYIKEEITFFDTLDQELTGIQYMKDIENYKIYLGNGETVKVKFSYPSTGCPTIDTSFVMGTKFLPELDFEFEAVCFGDSTTIFNNSNFNEQLSEVKITIEGINPDFTAKGNFKCYLDSNGSSRSMQVSINQEGCIQTDTYPINNKLKPIGNFNFDKTCENEKLVIKNLSEAKTNDFSIQVKIANKSFTYESINSISIPDTIPDGSYPTLLVITNNNGCLDSASYSVTIDPVTYVSFVGLLPDYCENQDTSILTGSEIGGMFSGLFIENTTPGQAVFRPDFDTNNVNIQYSFTNEFGCKDSTSQVVVNVYPKPTLILSGLDDTYCELDDPATLTLNQDIPNNSIFNEFLNGNKINEQKGITYTFNPILPGNYTINNFYTDGNGCFSELENSTVVNPLPSVSLDSLRIIIPGHSITIGNNSENEPNVIYEWSNGDTNAFTQIDQPGLYFLTALNTETLCMKSDSIEIKYDKNIKEDLFNIKIYPNPTSSIINIELGSQKNDIRIFKLNGSPVSIGGNTSFSTDIFGKLVLDSGSLDSGYYCIKIPDVGDFLVLKI